MALQKVTGVSIRGIGACVPATKINNLESAVFATPEDAKRFVDNTGVAYRHVVNKSGICTSDLCVAAANKLIDTLAWNREEINCLVFVSQTPDYILPATSCIIQNRLGLSKDCFAIDISLGCSGWVYGLSVISSLMTTGNFKKGLLLVGDTTTVTKSEKDKSTYPLFGDAGTATALEYNPAAKDLHFHSGTDGAGYEAIIIRDGGFRNFFTEASLQYKEYEGGIARNNLQSELNGASVFTFGITKAPQSVKALLEFAQYNIDEVDYFVFHQANMMMNDKIRSKLKIAAEKVPYSITDYGNTSSASIPLTIVSRLQAQLAGNSKTLLACGFGVGLSWGSVIINLDDICCTGVTEL
jgi:3-oxoacyl-[acyl-carrier-protein] synthase III